MIVCGDITKDGSSKSKVDPCAVCSLSVKANSVLCVQRVKGIHCRCVEMKLVAANIKKMLFLAGYC